MHMNLKSGLGHPFTKHIHLQVFKAVKSKGNPFENQLLGLSSLSENKTKK